MLGLPILDVAIGLIFIYLLLSLVVSAANEVLASILRWRATMLWQGLETVLGDPKMAEKLYDHPLMKALRRGGTKRPSYIPARTFALALVDTVAPVKGEGEALARIRTALAPKDGQWPSEIARALAVLLEDAGGDLGKFKASIEVWFDSAMERISGWYKRRLQWVTLLLALVITVGANVDTVTVGNLLWRDPAVRAALVAQAQTFVQEAQQQQQKTPKTAAAGGTQEPGAPPPPPARLPFESAEATPAERLEASLERIQALEIPVGWKQDAADPFGAIPRHLLGWLLTTLAVSLGAPFWFDMLKKVISIRAAGKAPGEGQKSPPAAGEAGEAGKGGQA